MSLKADEKGKSSHPDSVIHSGHGIPTPFWCTIRDRDGVALLCEPLLLPLGVDTFSSITYTSRPLHGSRVRFAVVLTPDHLRPYMDEVNIMESLLCCCGPKTRLLQRVCCNSEKELLAFRAVNGMGITLAVTRAVNVSFH